MSGCLPVWAAASDIFIPLSVTFHVTRPLARVPLGAGREAVRGACVCVHVRRLVVRGALLAGGGVKADEHGPIGCVF